MPGYNFLDPNQVNEFETKARAAGRSYDETQKYINTKINQQMRQRKLGLDIRKQDLAEMKLSQDILDLQSGKQKIGAAGS